MSKASKQKPGEAGDVAPFEQLLEEVDAKLKALEEGDLSLDDSLKAYEAGVRALRGCYAHLKSAEGRIEILSTNAAEPEVADFDAESGAASGKPRKVPAKKRGVEAAVSDAEDEDGLFTRSID